MDEGKHHLHLPRPKTFTTSVHSMPETYNSNMILDQDHLQSVERRTSSPANVESRRRNTEISINEATRVKKTSVDVLHTTRHVADQEEGFSKDETNSLNSSRLRVPERKRRRSHTRKLTAKRNTKDHSSHTSESLSQTSWSSAIDPPTFDEEMLETIIIKNDLDKLLSLLQQNRTALDLNSMSDEDSGAEEKMNSIAYSYQTDEELLTHHASADYSRKSTTKTPNRPSSTSPTAYEDCNLKEVRKLKGPPFDLTPSVRMKHFDVHQNTNFQDIPPQFRNATHLAIKHNSITCLKALLVCGFSPNIIGNNTLGSQQWNTDVNKLLIAHLIPSEEVSGSEKFSQMSQIEQQVFIETKSVLSERVALVKRILKTCYSMEYFFDYPPILLAAYLNNFRACRLLINAGAQITIADSLGNTPSHFLGCRFLEQLSTSRLLLANGAKISIKNRLGVSAENVWPVMRLELFGLVKTALQSSIFVSSHKDRSLRMTRSSGWRSKNHIEKPQLFLDEDGTDRGPLIIRSARNSAERSFKERSNKEQLIKSESFEIERSFSISSLRMAKDRESFVFGARRQYNYFSKFSFRGSRVKETSERMRLEDAEKALAILSKLATNDECISSVLEGISSFVQGLLTLSDPSGDSTLDLTINKLFNQIIMTCNERLQDSGLPPSEKYQIFCDMANLLESCYNLLKRKQTLHYSTLVSINKILDVCFKHSIYDIMSLCREKSESTDSHESHSFTAVLNQTMQQQHGRRHSVVTALNSLRKDRSSICVESGSGASGLSSKREADSISSGNSYSTSPVGGTSTEAQTGRGGTGGQGGVGTNHPKKTVLEKLFEMDPGIVVNVLHSGITLQRRTIGFRPKCTPSVRLRSCAHHCSQILCARILAIMCHNPFIQQKLVADGHLKTLVDALDPNHDPHLLCLILQCIACIALDPAYHETMIETLITDSILQLLLPSDEWYYTNHTTAYAPYVKYHSARILVYLGQFHCLAGRFDLYNLPALSHSIAMNGVPLLTNENIEDAFIEQMAVGRLFAYREDSTLSACSVEGLIRLLLEDSSKTSDYHPMIESQTTIHHLVGSDIINYEYISDQQLREALITSLPSVIHPLILIRLLNHRLFGSSYSKRVHHSRKSQPHPKVSDDKMQSQQPPQREMPSNLPVQLSPSKTTPTSLARSCLVKQVVLEGAGGAALLPALKKTTLGSCVASGSTGGICMFPWQLNELDRSILTAATPSCGDAGEGVNYPGGRRPSYTHFEYSKAEEEGFNIVCPWENNDVPVDSVECESSSENDEDNTMVAFMECNHRRFFRWKTSLKRKAHKLHDQLQEKEISSAKRQPRRSSAAIQPKGSVSPSDSVQKDLLDFQRELINLPKFSLDPSQNDTFSVSPSLLQSRSNSVPNITENGRSFAFTRQLSAVVMEERRHVRESSLPEILVSNSETMEPLKEAPEKQIVQHTIASAEDSPKSLSSSTANLSAEHCYFETCITEEIDYSKPEYNHSACEPFSPLVFEDHRHPTEDISNKQNHQLLSLTDHQQNPLNQMQSTSIDDVLSIQQNVLNRELRSSSSGFGPVFHSQEFNKRPNSYCCPTASIAEGGGGHCFNDQSTQKSTGIELIHKAAIHVLDSWMAYSQVDFHLIKDDVKEFLTRFSSFGSEQRLWSQNLWSHIKANEHITKTKTFDGKDKTKATNMQYNKLRQMVTSGDLPCTKDEAATLAAVHLHIDDAWPDPDLPPRERVNPLVLDVNRKLSISTRKSELITRPMNSSRIANGRIHRHSKLISRLSCVTDNDEDRQEREIRRILARYLPPDYHGSNKVYDLIKDKYKKLWHTPFYENEIKLKQLYIKLCRNLPGFGCRLYQLKEILRGNIHRNVPRLLAIGPEKIVLIDQKSKAPVREQVVADLKHWHVGGAVHGVELEFRGSKSWLLACTSEDSLRSVSAALWDVLDCDDQVLLRQNIHRNSLDFDLHKRHISLRPDIENCMVHSQELEELQSLIQFPEEVALLLSQSELRLFQSVKPNSYVRYVTIDLSKVSSFGLDKSVRDLITRLKEVSSWITHLVITQPTHEDRKAIFSCIVRLAVSCFNIGNFNAVVEILAGLKSEKLKPFWLTISDAYKEELQCLDRLSDLLLSQEPSLEYREAVARALNIPQCSVIPFFGVFLRQLKSIFNSTTSLVVLPPVEDSTVQCNSDFSGEDRYTSKIGVGGLMNMSKIRETLTILNDITLFQSHNREVPDTEHVFTKLNESSHKSAPSLPLMVQKCGQEEFGYSNCQSIGVVHNPTGITILGESTSGIDPHSLQVMHHGCTAVRYDRESQRSTLQFLKLSVSNSVLMWIRPHWRLNQSGITTTSTQSPRDSNITSAFDNLLETRYTSGVLFQDGIGEGYLDLFAVKQIYQGSRAVDCLAAMRKYGLAGGGGGGSGGGGIGSASADGDSLIPRHSCICLIHGTGITDNRVLYLIMPSLAARIWMVGLQRLVSAARSHIRTDQRFLWLQHEFLSLYYSKDPAQLPSLADITKVFGGRRWSESCNAIVSHEDSHFLIPRRSVHHISKRKKSYKPSVNNRSATKQLIKEGSDAPSSQSHPTNLLDSSVSFKLPRHCQHSTFASALRLDPQPEISNPNTSLSTFQHKRVSVAGGGQTPSPRDKTVDITQKVHLTFLDVVQLYRTFCVRGRQDIKDIFDKVAVPLNEATPQPDSVLVVVPNTKTDDDKGKLGSNTNLLTQNSWLDEHSSSRQQNICAAVAVASIVTNCTGYEKTRKYATGLHELQTFLREHQHVETSEADCWNIIQKHEPEHENRCKGFLSFEGFAYFLMDESNEAVVSLDENYPDKHKNMDHPLSHYFIASSHNTYLSGHQITGDSSVEMYTQVLLSGCRCVELDCWDGEDGSPVIYHGHTFTSKISFLSAVEAINRSAFVTTPYPLILSIENHCSLVQQQKMAEIFLDVFGERLVKDYLFESDLEEDPYLPSPKQLQFKILVKNKKINSKDQYMFPMKARTMSSYQRTSSMISADSGMPEEDNPDDEEEDDDEDDDQGKEPNNIPRSASKVQLESLGSSDAQKGARPNSQTPSETPVSDRSGYSNAIGDTFRKVGKSVLGDWQFEDTSTQSGKATPRMKHSKANQIARELSDLAVYTQAVKLRALNPSKGSPVSAPKFKKNTMRRSLLPVAGGVLNTSTTAVAASSTSGGVSSADGTGGHFVSQLTGQITPTSRPRRCKASPPAHQIASVNESKAKALCRRIPNGVISHTEKEMVRTYPGGKRLDSSNFNPVIFWSFGIQLVALNYQTDDLALQINSAMFEQNENRGYVLKPTVMWDKNHEHHKLFNPWEKELEGVEMTFLTIQVISGQNLSLISPGGNPQVEIESIGIPVDCAKQKTRMVSRNTVNPIWNDTFHFQITMRELAFLRFTVSDVNGGHTFVQRVVSLNCLQQGYRHLTLKSPSNTFLNTATLFLHIRYEDRLPTAALQGEDGQTTLGLGSETMLPTLVADISKKRASTIIKGNKFDFSSREATSRRGKPRITYIMVNGVCESESYTLLKISQESTGYDVIMQALNKSNRSDDSADQYLLIEEASGPEAVPYFVPMQENILQHMEKSLGQGRFVLKKKTDDPTSRAWMSTILSQEQTKSRESKLNSNNLSSEDRSHPTFLVCIYNVSPEQPYTILKAPISSTAREIISLAMAKAHRNDNPNKFVLMEEIATMAYLDSPGGTSRRKPPGKELRNVLLDTECVYLVQRESNASGKFVLMEKDVTCEKSVNVNNSGELLEGNTLNFDSSNVEEAIARRHSHQIARQFPMTNSILPSTQAPSFSPASNEVRIRTLSCPQDVFIKNQMMNHRSLSDSPKEVTKGIRRKLGKLIKR